MSVVLLGGTPVKTNQPRGIRIRHRTKRFGLALVPVYKKPFLGLLRECVTCQVTHKVKTLHLPLDASGACLVSEGVLEELKLANMAGFDIVADIVNPPSITLTNNRLAVDQANNQIRIWKEPVIV